MKIIGKILAVIFCILYFFGLSVLMTMSFATNFLSGDYYIDILKDIDLDTIKVSDLGEISEGSELDQDASVEDALISSLTKSGIDEKTAQAIIENNEIREIIGKFIGDYVNYKTGGEKPIISRKDVEGVLKNPDVIKALGKNPTEEDVDKIYNQLNNLSNEISEGGVENGLFKNSNNNNINR